MPPSLTIASRDSFRAFHAARISSGVGMGADVVRRITLRRAVASSRRRSVSRA